MYPLPLLSLLTTMCNTMLKPPGKVLQKHLPMLYIIGTHQQLHKQSFNRLKPTLLNFIDEESHIEFAIDLVHLLHVTVSDGLEDAHSDGEDVGNEGVVLLYC